jgi:hypothetical protein
MLTVHPRPERQAIFLGATEPTRCPTGKEPAAGGHVSKPRRAYGVNQQSGEPRLHVLASSGRMASLRRGFSLRVPLAAFGPATASHVGFRLSAEHMRPSSRLMSMGRRFAFNKTVEEYRRLAKECRETARTVSRENERSGLLAMADRWELIADRNADAAEGASENGRRASRARAREQ